MTTTRIHVFGYATGDGGAQLAPSGNPHTVSAETASRLISAALARDASQSPVSGGAITDAQARTGSVAGASIGELRVISDGQLAGTRVRWYQPAGYAAPAWCWDISPQDKYEGRAMPLPVNIKSSSGAAVDPLASVPVFQSDPSGAPLDGAMVTSSAVTAAGDILLTVPTRGVNTVFVDFTGGSSWGVVAESTIDGATWRACPMTIASRQIDTPVYSGITANSSRWVIGTAGGLITRLRITSVGTGTLTAVARASTAAIAENNLRARATPYRITSSLVSANIRTVAVMLVGIALDSSAAVKRYLQIYNKNSAPVIGTDTPVITYPIPAGGSLVAATLELPLTFGLAFAVTTDFAGGTAATAGDVVGTVLYTL